MAILLVLVSHLTFDEGSFQRSLGPVGVSIFFTLSGFLITALLLEERDRTGAVSLRRFFARRAARLLPAMVVMVTAVVVVGLAMGRPEYIGWPLVAGALTYSSNWVSLAGGGAGSALGHTWSLAIEEQFYLVWPLVFVAFARWGRRVLRIFLVAAIIASVVATALAVSAGGGWQRVYYGSDTRAAGLLIGCLVAVWLSGRRVPRGSSLAAAVGLGLIVASAPLSYRYAIVPLLTAVLTSVVIVASVGVRRIPALEWNPLCLVGRRAYGLYLWHYPVVVAADRVLDRPSMVTVVLVAVPVTALLAEISWRFIESPFLRRRAKPAPVTPATRVTQAARA